MKKPFDRATARYMYVLIRTDLTPAQQTVQAIHAGMQAVAQHGGLTHDTRLSLLSVHSLEELEEWARRCHEQGISFELFHEPDHDIGWSALATAPISAEQGRVFRRARLWTPAMPHQAPSPKDLSTYTLSA